MGAVGICLVQVESFSILKSDICHFCYTDKFQVESFSILISDICNFFTLINFRLSPSHTFHHSDVPFLQWNLIPCSFDHMISLSCCSPCVGMLKATQVPKRSILDLAEDEDDGYQINSWFPNSTFSS